VQGDHHAASAPPATAVGNIGADACPKCGRGPLHYTVDSPRCSALVHMEYPVELRAARGEVKLGRPPPVVRRRERGELGATRLGWSSGGTGSSEWCPAGRGGADGRE
jgi:hypothetical protein